MTNRRGIGGGLSFVDTYQISDTDAEYLDISEGNTVIQFSPSGAETRKLQDADTAGQFLTLSTDSASDVVVTTDTTINQAGDNTLTFTDIDDTIILQSCIVNTSNTPSTFKWRIVNNDGVALSTV